MLVWGVEVPYLDRIAGQTGCVSFDAPDHGQWVQLVNHSLLKQPDNWMIQKLNQRYNLNLAGTVTDKIVQLARTGKQFAYDEIIVTTVLEIDWDRVVPEVLDKTWMWAFGGYNAPVRDVAHRLVLGTNNRICPELYLFAREGANMDSVAWQWINDAKAPALPYYNSARFWPIFTIADAVQHGGAYSTCFPNPGWKTLKTYAILKDMDAHSVWYWCAWGFDYATPASIRELEAAWSRASIK